MDPYSIEVDKLMRWPKEGFLRGYFAGSVFAFVVVMTFIIGDILLPGGVL